MKHTEMIEVITAHAEGKAVQYYDDEEWHDSTIPEWAFNPFHYRVKPEPEYEAFKIKGTVPLIAGHHSSISRDDRGFVSINAREEAMEILRLTCHGNHMTYPHESIDAINKLKELIK